MKKIFLLLLVAASSASAQKNGGNQDGSLSSLKKNIAYLADDKLEGRRTGTPGEKLAYEFISAEFKKAGLIPYGDNNNFIQEFDVNEGKQIHAPTSLSIDKNKLELNKDFFPLAWSASTTTSLSFSFSQPKNPVVVFDLADLIKQNETNPHFDLAAEIQKAVAEAEKKEAAVFIITNSSSRADEIKFDAKDKTPVVKIPVIYLQNALVKSLLADQRSLHEVVLTTAIGEKKRVGHNVVGFVDNKAMNTVIIGAHYDHLGYGEDHNSLTVSKEAAIHNGADDNASGTAAMIELGKWAAGSGFRKNNYLFIAFSGEELGLFGSKYFTEHSPINLSSVNYMINMDMIGRLNDSTRGISIGGYGTSPAWSQLISLDDEYFKIKVDSSGSGPSDHTSFYRKDIPVLFFFTGTHSDYHKPTDDADKINYTGELYVINYIKKIIAAADSKPKLAFTKTREAAATGKNTFKVSLGIMPDYTYSGDGVLVDGVSEGRAAQKAGIKTGDVLYQLGEHKFSDVQTYMSALNKFNKGDSTKVKARRGKEELEFSISF